MTRAIVEARIQEAEWARDVVAVEFNLNSPARYKIANRVAELRAQAAAAPNVEPAAWRSQGGEGEVFSTHYEAASNSTASMPPVLLYAAPPDLTAEVARLRDLLQSIYDQWREDGSYRVGQDIERIKAALKETGK